MSTLKERFCRECRESLGVITREAWKAQGWVCEECGGEPKELTLGADRAHPPTPAELEALFTDEG